MPSVKYTKSMLHDMIIYSTLILNVIKLYFSVIMCHNLHYMIMSFAYGDNSPIALLYFKLGIATVSWRVIFCGLLAFAV